MKKIAEIHFPDLVNNPMLHHFASTPTIMTNESLFAMLEHYSNLFNIPINVIKYNGDIPNCIDLNVQLNHALLPSNNQEGEQKFGVFIVYDEAKQLFIPLCVCQDDGNVKLSLERYESDMIEENVLVPFGNRSSHGKIKIYKCTSMKYHDFLFNNNKTQ